MTAERGPENPTLPTHSLAINEASLPWYDAIAHSLRSFPDSSFSYTSTPVDNRVHIEAAGTDRDISRFRRLTSILHDSLSRRETQVETSARMVEALDLMQAQTHSAS